MGNLLQHLEDQETINTFFFDIGFDINLLKDFKKIYVLVSGGFDSTLLYDYIFNKFPDTTYAVNCFNPYEQSKTLNYFKKLPNFIMVKDPKGRDYKQILIDAFKQLPQAFEKYKLHEYYKKLFGCCYYIKHQTFLKDKMFKEEGSVVISGIKWGDGRQRRIFLSQMAKGKPKIGTSKKVNNYEYIKYLKYVNYKQDKFKDVIPTFLLKRRGGQLYCYPYRNFKKGGLPSNILEILRFRYPFIAHSGCALCPVLILNNIVSEGDRYENSIKFAKRLGLAKTLTLIKAWNIKEKNEL